MVYIYVPKHFLSRKDLSCLDNLIYIRIISFCRCTTYNNTCFASNIWNQLSNTNILNKEEVITYMEKDNNKEIVSNIISYDTDDVMLWKT